MADDNQIKALKTEAFSEGDALQGYICRVALGEKFTAGELAEDSCLSHWEIKTVAVMTQAEARDICEWALTQS